MSADDTVVELFKKLLTAFRALVIAVKFNVIAMAFTFLIRASALEIPPTVDTYLNYFQPISDSRNQS